MNETEKAAEKLEESGKKTVLQSLSSTLALGYLGERESSSVTPGEIISPEEILIEDTSDSNANLVGDGELVEGTVSNCKMQVGGRSSKKSPWLIARERLKSMKRQKIEEVTDGLAENAVTTEGNPADGMKERERASKKQVVPGQMESSNSDLSRRYACHIAEDSVYNLIQSMSFETSEEKLQFEQKVLKMNAILEDELELIKSQHMRLKAEKFEKQHPTKEDKNSVKKISSWLNNLHSLKPFGSIAKADVPQMCATIFKDIFETVSLQSITPSILRRQSSDLEAIEELDLEAEANSFYLDPNKMDLSEFEDFTTKKMKLDGGLWYEDGNSRRKLLKYDALPPSLSLNKK
eukprot:gene7370-8190_t